MAPVAIETAMMRASGPVGVAGTVEPVGVAVWVEVVMMRSPSGSPWWWTHRRAAACPAAVGFVSHAPLPRTWRRPHL